MISRTNIVLAVLLGIVVLLAAMSGIDYSVPNVEILADLSMKYTPASTAYEPSEVFANGMTQQEPIPGTIARGEMPRHFIPLPENIDPKDSVPGKEVVNPFSLEVLLQQAQVEFERADVARKNAANKSQSSGEPAEIEETETPPPAGKVSDTTAADSNTAEPASDDNSKPADAEKKESPDAVARRRLQASVDRGNDIFLAFCICCHGPAGKGDGMVAQRGYPPPPSNFLSAKPDGTPNEWSDGQLFYILTTGRRNMPQFAAQLPRESRWDVINYVRKLQEAAGTSVPDEQTEPDQAAGKQETTPATSSDNELKKKPETESSTHFSASTVYLE